MVAAAAQDDPEKEEGQDEEGEEEAPEEDELGWCLSVFMSSFID